MGLVSCAWGAFGAAFGPVILLSLYWKRLTYTGALAGIIAGFLIDLLWYAYLAAETGVYEIVPGFFGGTLITITVSCCTRKPDDEVMELFQKANLKEEEKIPE
jgi:sodium/proline symporter